MMVLLTTRGSSGHLLPLAPFGHACLRAGHEVLVAAQRQNRDNVDRTGLAFAPLDDPPAEEWMPLLEEFGDLDIDTSNAVMIRDFFGGIDVRAALPGLTDIVDSWRPDVIVRENWEFASTLLAEKEGIPLVRVGLGVAAVDELSIELAAPALEEAAAGLGVAPDPAGRRLRDTPYFTMVPERLEDPGVPVSPHTHRFRTAPPEAGATPLDWWPGNHDPLVYLTFGSVTAGAHLPYFPALYRAALEALAPLPVRLLVTIGNDADPGELDPLPPNVHVEPWVPQDDVARQADAIVCHGGYGSTLGALAHGVPLVVVPLFSTDQWANAQAVARAGAGLALDADRATRRVMALPDADTLGQLPAAVERVLGDPGYRSEATRIAEAMRALPPVETAVDVLASIAAPR